MLEPEPTEGLKTRNHPRAARDAMAQMIETKDVDSVVLIWTVHRKGKTTACLAWYGNEILTKSLVNHVADKLEERDEEDGLDD